MCISHNVTEALDYLKIINVRQTATSTSVTMNINGSVASQLIIVASNVDKRKEA